MRSWPRQERDLSSFNPRPAPRSRATRDEGFCSLEDCVSIHARLRGAGRPSDHNNFGTGLQFQSTPGSEEPGDPAIIAVGSLVVVSIHARLRGAGRPNMGAMSLSAWKFQSTPGSEEPGDRRGKMQRRWRHSFQSTPGSEEPGDQGRASRYAAAVLFQSTPGSEEPGDATRPRQCSSVLVSIHARLRGAGRRVRMKCQRPRCRFNPRPAPRSRATGSLGLLSDVQAFQSTPGSEEPGDRERWRGAEWESGFNPRPAPRSRATRMSTQQLLDHDLFQSTPGSEEPGDDMLQQVRRWI